MKKILFLLFPVICLGQTYTSQNTGSAYYHTQNRGGIGADITLKAPVTDASTVFSFDMKGLIRVNSTGNWLEFHNGIGWTKALDINTVFTKATVGLSNVDNTSDAMKPLSNATINALLGKFNLPTGTASEYLDGTGNPRTFPSVPSTTSDLPEGSNLYWSLARFNTAFSGKSTDNLPEGPTNKYDRTVSISGNNGIATAGSYPNFTITKKRQETYSGTTSASGTYTVAFPTAFSVSPNIQANIIGASDTQNIRITSVSATGFTVLVRNRVDVVGLLPTWNNVSGAQVDILVTEK